MMLIGHMISNVWLVCYFTKLCKMPCMYYICGLWAGIGMILACNRNGMVGFKGWNGIGMYNDLVLVGETWFLVWLGRNFMNL